MRLPSGYVTCCDSPFSHGHSRPVASQPDGGVWTWMGGTPGAHPPPLGHCPRDVINLKNAPTLGHSQAPPPPLDIARVTSSTYSKGGNKIAKGWNKIAEGWNKIAKGWNKIAEGWNKIAKGWNKIAERWNKIAKGWNKIAKGWNKIAKGWNKIFGMGNWGGSYDPPDPPPWLRACIGCLWATRGCLHLAVSRDHYPFQRIARTCGCQNCGVYRVFSRFLP